MKGIDPIKIKEGFEPKMKISTIKQTNILELPDKIINENLNYLYEQNRGLKLDANLIKDNAKLINFIESEYDNLLRTRDDLKEESEVLVFGQGTDKEKRILQKDVQIKSIEELKALGFEEVSSVDMKVDDEGNLRTQSEGMPPELAEKLNEEFKLSEFNDGSNDLYDNSNRGLNDSNQEFKRISEIVHGQDEKRINNIMKALQSGTEVNDPIYYTMIVERDEWMKKRVNYLKKHYSGDKNINLNDIEEVTYEKHYELAEKFGSDDELFYKYETPEAKKYTAFVEKSYYEGDTIDPTKETSSLYEENEEYEDLGDLDFRTFMKDRVKELKRDDIGKKNYDYERGEEIPDDNLAEGNYKPGSNRKNKNKSLRKV